MYFTQILWKLCLGIKWHVQNLQVYMINLLSRVSSEIGTSFRKNFALLKKKVFCRKFHILFHFVRWKKLQKFSLKKKTRNVSRVISNDLSFRLHVILCIKAMISSWKKLYLFNWLKIVENMKDVQINTW